MRFHLPALPGRSISRENSSCAYSGYVRKMARMMEERGHEVYVYDDYDTDEPVDFAPDLWEPYNCWVADQIDDHAEPQDFLGIIGGISQQLVADLLPHLMPVEYRVGYGGTFTQHRVFETYAWQHVVYGAQQGAHTANGCFYDTVILPPFEVEDFPAPNEAPDDYLLYMGRMIERKGVGLAAEIAERAERPLLLAGEGPDVPSYGHHLGHVGPDERGELLRNAHAVLAPTLYVEPGGGVAIEAQLCGTPVITTDWGCFVETVTSGGFRCRTMAQFVAAVAEAGNLDRDPIREQAISRHSLETIGYQYEEYMEGLATLWGAGFYAGV